MQPHPFPKFWPFATHQQPLHTLHTLTSQHLDFFSFPTGHSSVGPLYCGCTSPLQAKLELFLWHLGLVSTWMGDRLGIPGAYESYVRCKSSDVH